MARSKSMPMIPVSPRYRVRRIKGLLKTLLDLLEPAPAAMAPEEGSDKAVNIADTKRHGPGITRRLAESYPTRS